MSPASGVELAEEFGEDTGVRDGCSVGVGVEAGTCVGVRVGTSAVEELTEVAVGAGIVGVVSSLRATWDTQAGTVKIETANIMAKTHNLPAAEPLWMEEGRRFDFTNASSLSRVP